MKYTIKWTSRFKKEYKLLMKRGEDVQALDNVIRLLSEGVKLPPECRDHVLSGRYAGLVKIKKNYKVGKELFGDGRDKESDNKRQ